MTSNLRDLTVLVLPVPQDEKRNSETAICELMMMS